MATYEFATPDGKIKTVEASSPQEAQSKIAALGAAPRSGVALATGQGMGATTESGRRNLELASGNPASSLLQTGAAASQVQQTADPYARFNEGIMQLLTRHQAMGTKRFQEQEYNAQEAQNNRVLEKTPRDLIGAAPGVQNSVRSASAGALDPTINQARNAQQTFGEQLRSYGDAIGTARDFVKEARASEENKRKEAQSIIEFALSEGADALNDLAPEELAELEKRAGFPKGYVAGVAKVIRAREAAAAAKKASSGGGGSGGGSSSSNNSKGRMSNKQFVDLSLKRSGISYEQALAQVPQGQVGVVDNATGQIGYIDPLEYNTKQYTYL